ncbi:MAG TPA: hypothetical protein VG929_11325 [Actinomycetota bacterium]|nr:hypothetical protein [Actinomycetota bacterium]
MDRSDLDIVLHDVGRQIEWPEPSTGFTQRVTSRISADESAEGPPLRRVAMAFAALVPVFITILALSPATREAVADFIGLGGVRIETVDPDAIETPMRGRSLRLGSPTTLEGARAAVAFPVRVPSLRDLGPPDAIYLDRDTPPGGMVSLVYGDRTGFEASAETGISVLITQFSARLMRPGQVFQKGVPATTVVERVRVDGVEAYWLSGAPHAFYYRTVDGVIGEEPFRVVDEVLLWEHEGVTFRIEANVSLDKALAIARSLR